MLTEKLPSRRPLNEDDLWMDEPSLFDWDAEKVFSGGWDAENVAKMRGDNGYNR